MNKPPLPYPDKDFRLPCETIDTVEPWAENYFENIIKCYGPDVQTRLRRMYYQYENVFFQKDFIKNNVVLGEDQNKNQTAKVMVACATYRPDDKDMCVDDIVVSDPVCLFSSLVTSWLKLHKIGVHVGQRAYVGHALAVVSKRYKDYTELSAAACEYHFIHPIKKQLCEKEVASLEKIKLNGDIELNTPDLFNIFENIIDCTLPEYLGERAKNYRIPKWRLDLFKTNFDAQGERQDMPFFAKLIDKFDDI